MRLGLWPVAGLGVSPRLAALAASVPWQSVRFELCSLRFLALGTLVPIWLCLSVPVLLPGGNPARPSLSLRRGLPPEHVLHGLTLTVGSDAGVGQLAAARSALISGMASPSPLRDALLSSPRQRPSLSSFESSFRGGKPYPAFWIEKLGVALGQLRLAVALSFPPAPPALVGLSPHPFGASPPSRGPRVPHPRKSLLASGFLPGFSLAVCPRLAGFTFCTAVPRLRLTQYPEASDVSFHRSTAPGLLALPLQGFAVLGQILRRAGFLRPLTWCNAPGRFRRAGLLIPGGGDDLAEASAAMRYRQVERAPPALSVCFSPLSLTFTPPPAAPRLRGCALVAWL